MFALLSELSHQNTLLCCQQSDYRHYMQVFFIVDEVILHFTPLKIGLLLRDITPPNWIRHSFSRKI